MYIFYFSIGHMVPPLAGFIGGWYNTSKILWLISFIIIVF